jgi:hypothetical protein
MAWLLGIEKGEVEENERQMEAGQSANRAAEERRWTTTMSETQKASVIQQLHIIIQNNIGQVMVAEE